MFEKHQAPACLYIRKEQMSHANPQVKLSRKLNLALTPKASRYRDRRHYPPGEHGPQKTRRIKVSDYKQQLLEKQRLRLQYNIREKQMRNYVRRDVRRSGNAADNMVQALEGRLDAMVYRGGFARTLPAARTSSSAKALTASESPSTAESRASAPEATSAAKSRSVILLSFTLRFGPFAARPGRVLLRGCLWYQHEADG